ncbi:protein asteroid [Leptopilina boulardi]|uniref:protein asteroid n=1 Tax=Leptopilina boulardi TaxID=63433 RepID=UPI0021F53411|nr:protein asteroid [Leptopilina boulardi]
MGIRGLATYMAQRSDWHLKPFELHNTYLVIDGNALASQLYIQHAKCNCSFGGDYDKYARTICEFFDSLAKCNITPLVIFDGGCEEKKIKTVRKRIRDKVGSAFGYNPTTQRSYKFFPLLMKEVFKEILSKKGINYVQTLFEADDEIASVARILNCPVLSLDSDFYIYNVMYIPINTLDPFMVQNRPGIGYVKRCKIYRVESLLKQFPGLDSLHLPLASTLLGNDYVNCRTFKEFFLHLRLAKATKMRYNQQQRRIEATILWLSKHSFHNAITQILARLPQESRSKVLEIIEMIVNVYTTSDPQILISLGFPMEFVSEMKIKFKKEPFKYKSDDDIKNFRPEEDVEDGEELECDLTDLEEEEMVKDDPEFRYDPNIEKVAPPWFIEEFQMGRYASYFIDIFTRRFYVCPPQIEDYSYPAAIKISTKIISVIYSLLTKGLQGPVLLSYLCRGSGKNVIVNKLEAKENMLGCQLPNLFDLRKLPIIIRKKILDETLGIPEMALATLPNEWQLYVATIIFWMSQQEKPSGTNCHLYSLLYSMLFSVVDNKIGYHRSEQYFHQKYDQHIKTIFYNRENQQHEQLNQNLTIFQAYCQINIDDCLLAAPFLLNNFEIDQHLLWNVKKFNISIVHAFAQFQICLRHSVHLNALLGFPYQQTRISELFNGTLVYNLYTNFKGRNDIDAYVFHQLQNSPTLLRLFNLLLANIKGLLKQDVLDNKVNCARRRRKRNKVKNCVETTQIIEPEDSTSFYDVNNRFSMLRGN